MSELDTYLLVTLGSTICGFFIGMGTVLVLEEEGYEPEREKKNRGSLERLAFAGANLLGMGYLFAWLAVSSQPMFKLIPILILATMVGVFGGSLTRGGIASWVPAVGMVVMPTVFHVSRYFGLV